MEKKDTKTRRKGNKAGLGSHQNFVAKKCNWDKFPNIYFPSADFKEPDYLGSNKVNRVLHVNYENCRLAEMKHIQSWFRNFRFFHELVLIHSIFLLKLSVVSL